MALPFAAEPAATPWSAEAQVLVRPTATYRALAGDATRSASWWRRPLVLLLVLACGVSLFAAQRVTPRIIVDAAIGFAFIPMSEAAGLAIVWARQRSLLPFARCLDVFFVGNAPWLVWLITITALASVAWPAYWDFRWFLMSLVPPIVWSAWLDIVFLRVVLGQPRGAVIRSLLVQRAVAWLLAFVYFLGIAEWPDLAGLLGL